MPSLSTVCLIMWLSLLACLSSFPHELITFFILFYFIFSGFIPYQRKSVLFIGTQFSILYTFMYSPA